MAILRQSFDGGTTGANVDSTTTLSSGGDAFSYVAVAAGSTFTFDTAQAAHGTKSAKIVPVSGGSTLGAYTVSGSAVAARIYVYLAANPTDDLYLIRIEGATSGTRILSIHLQNDGKMAVRDGNGGNLFLSAAAVPLNQWLRFEIYGKVGTTTTGVIKAAVYSADSTTPIGTLFSTTTANLNTASFNLVQVGKANASLSTTSFWLDEIAVDTTATDLIGPWVLTHPTPLMTVSPGATGNEPWSTVTVTASTSDGPTSWTFAQVAGPAVTLNPSGNTVSFVAPVSMDPSNIVISAVANYAGGVSPTATTSVDILGATEAVNTGVGGWSPVRIQTMLP